MDFAGERTNVGAAGQTVSKRRRFAVQHRALSAGELWSLGKESPEARRVRFSLSTETDALRDIELRAILDADRLGVPQERPQVGLKTLHGVEVEPYAAELARVTLWIGNLQWERRNGYSNPPGRYSKR